MKSKRFGWEWLPQQGRRQGDLFQPACHGGSARYQLCCDASPSFAASVVTGKAPSPPTLTAPAAPQPARGEGGAELFEQSWLADGELVDAAYGETLADAGLQTSLPPPERLNPPPEWLLDLVNAIKEFFLWSGPVLKWTLLVLAMLLLLLLAYRLLPGFAAWVDQWRKRAPEDVAEEAGLVEAAAARARLADADALAAAGRFAEAVHMLLYRSVDDIAARRPGLVKPALTSRDLAASDALPGVARGAFSRIAGAVEISLFGGHDIDAAVWNQCRDAYAELTVPRNWASA